jgi:sensor histidine kinase YesM
MILQPIYENAVKHGVYESTEPIYIMTECKVNDSFLELRITNNFDTTSHAKKGAGIGLKNIKERLKLIYGNPDFLKTKIIDDKFIAELIIPQKEI